MSVADREGRNMALQIAVHLLAERGQVLYDQMARLQRLHWPLWFDLLRHLHSAPAGASTEKAAARLRSGDLEPESAHRGEEAKARLERTARVAAAAYGLGPGFEASNLEEELLLAVFAEHPGPFEPCEPACLAACPHRVELPVLLVDPARGHGVVAHLRLWRVPVGRHAGDRLRLVRAPASQLLQLDLIEPDRGGFRQALDRVSTLLKHQPALVAADYALVWDLMPFLGATQEPGLLDVGGGSLGAAFALAALYLVRESLGHDWQSRLEAIDWQKAAISAQLQEGGFALAPVSGLREKLSAWQSYLGAPQAVFVDRRQPSLGQVAQQGASDVFELLHRVAEHASDLSPDQARLFMRLRSLPADEGLATPEDRQLLARLALDDHPIRSIRGYLLQRYVHCAFMQGRVFPGRDARSDLRFVNLSLAAEASAAGFDPREPARRFDSLASLLESVEGVDVWQIRAEPGAGKSTLLRNYEMTQARQALARWDAWSAPVADAQQRRELCVAIPVTDLPANADFAQWIGNCWKSMYPRLPPLGELLGRYRLRFLVDGLNEIRSADDADRARRVLSIVLWLDSLNDIVAPVFAVRSLEATHPLTGSRRLLARRDATLERWSDDDIARYCSTWPENEAGARLLATIAQDPPLREMCSLPLNLAAQCELLAAGLLREPVRDRGQLFSALLWARLQREFEGLVGDGHLNHWETVELNRLRGQAGPPDRSDLLKVLAPLTLVRGLLAQALCLTRTRGTLLPVRQMHEPPASGSREAWLRAVCGLGIVEIVPGWERSLRFQHHLLWQDYFAALALVQMAESQWPDFRTAPLKPIEEARATGQPLSHSISDWEEPIKLAVHLDPDPARWMAHLVDCNPGLAGRAAAARIQAVAAGRPHGLEAILPRLREHLLAGSRSPALDLRVRVEAAEALGDVGDPRYVDGRIDPGRGRPCLVPRADCWVPIPSGRYPIGGDPERADNRLTVEVCLEPYEMAFAPVTNAEFRCFIEDGGYEDRRWWPDRYAQDWLDGKNEDTASIELWRRRRRAAHAASDDAALARAAQQEFPSKNSQVALQEMRRLRAQSAADFEQWVEVRFAGRKFRQPFYWNEDRFNRSAQPVVCIGLYEARAYCLWASERTGMLLRLPTEAEWEVAARDPVQQHSRTAAFDRCNAFDTGFNRPLPAGVFPAGDFRSGGLFDAVGGVWEWTISPYAEAGLSAETAHGLAPPELNPGALFAIRGASWRIDSSAAALSLRGSDLPGDRFNDNGFRLVRGPRPGP